VDTAPAEPAEARLSTHRRGAEAPAVIPEEYLIIKSTILALGTLATLAAPAVAADAPPGVAHVTAKTLEGQVSRTKDGLATNPVPTGPNGPTVLIVRRDRSGEVELHETQNDVFVAHAGRAKVVVGGRASGQRLTAPHEWRGGAIAGGTSYPMSPGDTLFIPAGLPHQVVVPKGGTFSYLAFKSNK
jgi:mannose-6-phosphate isomerase-like protein (cupin superfamily)